MKGPRRLRKLSNPEPDDDIQVVDGLEYVAASGIQKKQASVPAKKRRSLQCWFSEACRYARGNVVLVIVAVVALIQLPATVWFFCHDRTVAHEEVKKAVPQAAEVAKVNQNEPPLLPYRKDPFVPLPDSTTSSAGETNHSASGSLPGLARISGPSNACKTENASPRGTSLLPVGLPMHSVAFNGRVRGNGVQPNMSPVPMLKIAPPPADTSPKLRGVMGFGASRLAVVETHSGEVTYIKSAQTIPETKLTLGAIVDDGVYVVSHAKNRDICRKVLIGKQMTASSI